MRAQDFCESVSSCIGKSLIRMCLPFILNSKSTTATSPPLILNKIISNSKSNHRKRVGKSKNTTLSGFQIPQHFAYRGIARVLFPPSYPLCQKLRLQLSYSLTSSPSTEFNCFTCTKFEKIVEGFTLTTHSC